MTSSRNDDERPLTARSVVASTLLGLDPPVLAVGRLVATAGLFGISEGAARVALSRMAATGEVEVEAGDYRLTGRLLERQARQEAGRRPALRRWSGRWRLAVVVHERRSAATRADLRVAMAQLHMAELREGVWVRPDNLATTMPEPVRDQCRVLLGQLEDEDEVALSAELWDLEGWRTSADDLRRRLTAMQSALDGEDVTSLAPGFVLSAAVLRLLAADPLLPEHLLPDPWPGAGLRHDYATFDASYRRLLSRWHAGGGGG